MIQPRAFTNLLRRWEVQPSDALPVFERLVAAHEEPHRYYHTLEHVQEVLSVLGRYEGQEVDLPVLALAAWFHDSVYDPRATDNEARSASLSGELLEPLGVPLIVLGRVEVLIRATAHFTGDEVENRAKDPDRDALLDADLAILGAVADRYERYARDIRREYAFVSEDAYRRGRTTVLEGFLARPRLYRTELMSAQTEAARTNLHHELALLKGSAF